MKTDIENRLQKIETILSAVLPCKTTTGEIGMDFGRLPAGVRPDHLVPLVEPCAELISRGGKRWRPLFLVLCAESFVSETNGALLECAYRLTPLVELTHTASLIHDDIEDSSDMRRGAPAAHLTWGIDTALNAGSWLYFQAASCINSSGADAQTQNRLYALWALEVRRLHLGQAMDIAWHKDERAYPAADEYLAMARLKTGTLASLAAKTGVLALGADDAVLERAGSIASDIGAAFQILDDVRNLTYGNPGKKRGDDVIEGKKSYPVILHVERAPRGVDVKSLIAADFAEAKRDGIESPAVERFIARLHESGALKDAREKAESMILSAASSFSTIFGTKATAIEELFRGMLSENQK